MTRQAGYCCKGDRICTRGVMQSTLSALSRHSHLIKVTVFSWYVKSRSAVAVQHIRQLQKSAESHSNEITVMNNSLQSILNELKTLSTIADTAAASVQFGIERQDTSAKMTKLVSRMHVLQQVCHQPWTSTSQQRLALISAPLKTTVLVTAPFMFLAHNMHYMCLASRCQACCSAV